MGVRSREKEVGGKILTPFFLLLTAGVELFGMGRRLTGKRARKPPPHTSARRVTTLKQVTLSIII
jgi:hypothetical protein